jgi:hypothetical protein
MILDIIQIFRARRDKALASKLAVRLAHGQLLDRATAPLLLIHIGLWTVSIMAGVIAFVLFIASETLHSALGFVAMIPLLFCLVPAWISLRLKAGLDRVRDIAASYSDAQLERLFAPDLSREPSPASDNMGETAPSVPPDNHRPDNHRKTRDAP